MAIKTREKKLNVEDLQDNHLTGPANESIDEVERGLQVDQVVVANEMPKADWIVFRNQRDPGHPLEFHYASGTHPFKMYKLIDGERYQLPIEVIRNLERCREDIHKYRKNSQGVPEVYVAGYKTHFVCERA